MPSRSKLAAVCCCAPLVQALVVLFAAVVVVANFLVDLAYGFIDPKLRLSA